MNPTTTLTCVFLFIIQLHTSKATDAHKQTIKTHNLGLDQVPFYAEVDVSETLFVFTELLSRIHACGNRLVWRHRRDFIARRNETELILGPIILAATGGPTSEEQEYFRQTPSGQQIVLLHPSDEFVSQTDPSIYGDGVTQVFRNYFHRGLGDESLQYLLQTSIGHVPRVLWMPLGLANLRPLPAALKFEFTERPYLWAWAGDTEGKPERAEMLQALAEHASSDQVSLSPLYQNKHYKMSSPSEFRGQVCPATRV